MKLPKIVWVKGEDDEGNPQYLSIEGRFFIQRKRSGHTTQPFYWILLAEPLYTALPGEISNHMTSQEAKNEANRIVKKEFEELEWQ